MSILDLKCETVEDEEFLEYKIEYANDDDQERTSVEEPNENTIDCGRIILHLEKNIWTFNCFFCELSFTEITEFMQHTNEDHIELLTIENLGDWETDSPKGGTANLEITPISPIKEEEEDNLYAIETNEVEEYSTDCMDVNKQTPPNFPHKCEYCVKSFRCKSKLRDHLRIHTGELPFKCDLCQKGFRTNDVLRFHRVIHSKENSFQCHHCDQSFNQKRYLQMHLKYHLGEQTFPCTVCGKSNRTSSQLKVHMTKHTLEKEYICEICGACYRLRQHLVIHLKQKHENKREFQCDKCDKAFNTIAFLNHHKLSHSKNRNHICNVCGMGFVWRKNLMEHIKLHIGTKNYKCDVCGKAFVQKSGLISHTKTHAS